MPLAIPPGIFANGTAYQAAGRWGDGNLVRFHEKTVQPIGGWIPRVTTGVAITGTAHAALSWLKADGTPLFAIGTETGLFIIDDNDVVYNVTPATGHAPPYNWQLSLFGTFLMAVNTLLGDDDITATNVFVWEGNTAAVAVAAFTTANGPQGAYAAFGTPERFFTILRGKDPLSAPPPIGVTQAYSERRVYFASQETIDTYIASDVNTAGEFDLTTDGRLVCGAAGRGQSLLWTDVDLWTMNYIGGDLIYAFTLAGSNCGIVSKRAAVVIDQGAYWMGRGKFFVYDGYVRTLPCEVTDHVFGNFADSFAHTVWSLVNPRFNEVTWFYPSAAAQTPDKYVTYNYQEGHWTYGSLRRSVGVSQRFRQDIIDAPVPVMFDDAQMYDHETGNERGGQAFLISGPVEAGIGDQLMRLQGILPDDKTAGDVELLLLTAMAPDDLEKLRGPFTLAAYTPLRATARQLRVWLQEVASSSWRVGNIRLAALPVERRGPGAAGAVDLTPASIVISPSAITLINAQHFTFTATVLNAEGQVIPGVQPTAWQSSNSAKVPIDDTGTVTALATPTTANITATLGLITSNTAVVTVAGDTTPASITLTPTSATITLGVTVPLTAVVKNAAGMILTRSIDAWFSDNTSSATVVSSGADTGTATGGSNGSANITAGITTPPLTSNACAITVATHDIVHAFDTPGSDTFTVLSGSGNVRTLIVGGGGTAGSVDGTGAVAGGGGAGGVIQETSHAVTPQAYAILVGGGSNAPSVDASIGVPVANGNNGGNSSFDTKVAVGGGGGGAGNLPTGGNRDGAAGGSGGGGGTGTGPGAGGAGTAAQGNNGAAGSGTLGPGGGGGGAGGVGTSGVGGAGVTDNIDGTTNTYGTGGNSTLNSAGSAATNIGGGGNGGGNIRGAAAGASMRGRVVIRYANSTGIVATGGTITII